MSLSGVVEGLQWAYQAYQNLTPEAITDFAGALVPETTEKQIGLAVLGAAGGFYLYQNRDKLKEFAQQHPEVWKLIKDSPLAKAAVKAIKDRALKNDLGKVAVHLLEEFFKDKETLAEFCTLDENGQRVCVMRASIDFDAELKDYPFYDAIKDNESIRKFYRVLQSEETRKLFRELDKEYFQGLGHLGKEIFEDFTKRYKGYNDEEQRDNFINIQARAILAQVTLPQQSIKSSM